MSRKLHRLLTILIAALMLIMCTAPTVMAAGNTRLSKTKVTLEIGQTASIKLLDTNGGKIKWSIGNSKVFKYKQGKITAVGEGKSYLTCTYKNKKYRCLVIVTKPSSGFSADRTNVSVRTGATTSVTVNTDGRKVAVQNNNPSICTIICGMLENDQFPLTIKAKKAGVCKLSVYNTAKKYEGFTITVTVSDDAAVEIVKSETADDVDSAIDEVIRIVNEEREAAGLPPLKKDETLNAVSIIRVAELSSKFSHDRPNGSSCFTALPSNFSYNTAGENIAYGSSTAEGVMNQWMNSPGHKANILNSDYTKIGVGYDPVHKYWVQFFAG